MTAIPTDESLFATLLNQVAQHAAERHITISDLPTLPPRPFPSSTSPQEAGNDLSNWLALSLTDNGAGLAQTFEELVQRITPSLSNSTGSRYFGLVTGGATPAATLADWFVTVYDQNTILYSEEAISGYSVVEDQAMRMMVDLFGLPREGNSGASKSLNGQGPYFKAMTTTGSTGSNIVGMAVGRQWLGQNWAWGSGDEKKNFAEDGYDGSVVVLTNMAHATVWKAASILGIGRKQVVEVATLGSGVQGDVDAFEKELIKWKEADKAVMVFLAFGEVNTGIFQTGTRQVAEICHRHGAYLHIDGAFGIYARCSPNYAHLADGLELAHSITACGHKWLNVPYDCGFFLYRQGLEKPIMEPVFSSSAAYLKPAPGKNSPSHPMNLSIENSRRFRALPVWATLRAYGKEGYGKIVEENCRFAKTMWGWMKDTRPDLWTVLTEECPLNIVVFCKARKGGEGEAVSLEEEDRENSALLKRINATGVAYFSPTVWKGRPAIRAAVSNWRTTVERDWEPVRKMLEEQALL